MTPKCTKTVVLKPCPCCGSADVEVYVIGFPWHYVECHKCGVGTMGMETKRKAVNAWNRRTNRKGKTK